MNRAYVKKGFYGKLESNSYPYYPILSNYLKQIIHARNTIGFILLKPGHQYLSTFFDFSWTNPHIRIEEFDIKEINCHEKTKKDITDDEKHKELNKLGIFCIVSFHNFNPNERWSSVKTCSTLIHLESLEIINRSIKTYKMANNLSLKEIEDVLKTVKNNNINRKNIEILVSEKITTVVIVSLVFSYIPLYETKFGKFMDIRGYSMLDEKQIKSLWESD